MKKGKINNGNHVKRRDIPQLKGVRKYKQESHRQIGIDACR